MNQFRFYGSSPMRYDNSRVHFAVCVPIIAVFVEAFSATSFKLGVLVWITAAVSMYAGCIADRKYLKACGFDVSSLTPLLVIPPLYVYKRSKLISGSALPCVVMVILILYAFVCNGFTQAALMDNEDKFAHVRENYAQNISGLDAAGLDTIEKKLDSYAGKDDKVKWKGSESSGRITVTAECKKFKIVFTVPFDGYAFGEISVTECIVGGKKYEGKEMTEKLNEIFSDSSENKDESSQESSSYTQA